MFECMNGGAAKAQDLRWRVRLSHGDRTKTVSALKSIVSTQVKRDESALYILSCKREVAYFAWPFLLGGAAAPMPGSASTWACNRSAIPRSRSALALW